MKTYLDLPVHSPLYLSITLHYILTTIINNGSNTFHSSFFSTVNEDGCIKC